MSDDITLSTKQAIEAAEFAKTEIGLYPENGLAFELIRSAAETAIGKPREQRTPVQQKALELQVKIDRQRHSGRGWIGGGRHG